MAASKQFVPKKRHCLVSSFKLVRFCGVRPPTSHGRCKVCLKARQDQLISASQTEACSSVGQMLFTMRCTGLLQPTNTCLKAANISGVIFSLYPIWHIRGSVNSHYRCRHDAYRLRYVAHIYSGKAKVCPKLSTPGIRYQASSCLASPVQMYTWKDR